MIERKKKNMGSESRRIITTLTIGKCFILVSVLPWTGKGQSPNLTC